MPIPFSDPDYEGSIKMIAANTSREPLTLFEGVSYVQMVPVRYYDGFVCSIACDDDEGMTGDVDDISDEEEKSRDLAQYLLEEEQDETRKLQLGIDASSASSSTAASAPAAASNGKTSPHVGFGSTGASALGRSSDDGSSRDG